ncbi:MAG: hypothetical protein ACREMF_05385, partial [Gemmatimonadales bacterium]
TPITSKILLRYHPPAGAVYRYELDQASRFAPDTVTADSGARNTMTLTFTQAIGTPGADGVPVTITFDSARVTSPMLNPASADDAARQLRGVRLTSVLDDRLQLVRNDFGALRRLPSVVGDQVLLGFRAAALPLPATPVGPGDSWTNQVELPFGQMPGGAPLQAETKVTVREITVTGSDTTVRLGVETRLPDRPLRFEMGGQRMTVALRGAITGEQLFSLTRGAMVHASLGGTMRVNLTGGFFGAQGMAMRVDQQGRMQLVEGN